MKHNRMGYQVLICLMTFSALGCGWLALSRPASAQIKAFPQAEGFGAEAIGGRGGDVYHVTSLSDNGSVGTLRHGIETAPTSGRTIVFDVGGWINLNSKLGIVNTKRNLTIAGQTAPGGIGVRGDQFSVGADDVIIRHMRFRPGKGAGRVDSVNVNGDAEDVIFDHVSAGFSYDENFSLQATDVTLQFSTVSFGLEDHSAGSLIEQAHRLSMHHNLYAHNNTRNPKARVNETLDWVNNVVYDFNIGFIAGDSGTNDYFWTANFDGNYYITGPNDSGHAMISSGHAHNFGLYFGTNSYDGDGDSVHDGEEFTRSSRTLGSYIGGTYTWNDVPYPVADPVWKDPTPQAAYDRVLSEFGATPWQRDEVDQLLHDNVVNRTGNRISRESDLAGIGDGGFGILTGGVAPADSDGDGMPDQWELKHAPLLVNTPSNNSDFDNDGYTDLEEYLNDTAAFKAAGPLKFEGEGRYADWGNWTRRWEPSRLDEVHIDQGTAVVDAAGQKAGSLSIGTQAGNVAALNISNGWLEVADRVVIGADPAATATLNLSGGRLAARELTKGEGGSFSFIGGELSADVVNFGLVNEGGMIAPGLTIGQTHIEGDLTIQSGRLLIELASASLADSITVEGDVMLGGDLKVKLLDGFVPESGSWEIIAATGNVLGSFTSVPQGYNVQMQGSRVFLYIGDALKLTGDYNDDGIVDAADYTVWRDTLSESVPSGTGADGDRDGMITPSDYLIWKNNFGASQGVAKTTAVPEADVWLLLAFGVSVVQFEVRPKPTDVR